MSICPESARLTALREGWLDADEAERLRGHVEGCDECRRLMSDLGEIVSVLSGQSGDVEPPPGGFEELMKTTLLLRDITAPLPVRSAPRWMWRTVAAAAAVVLAISAYTVIDVISPASPNVEEVTQEDEIPDFYLEEHALAAETLPFSSGKSTVIMVDRKE
jgi:hypothetical protein